MDLIGKVMSGKFDIYSDVGSAKDFLHLIVNSSAPCIKLLTLQRKSKFSSRNNNCEENLWSSAAGTQDFNLVEK